MATISAALREAISVGAPTYNGGNHTGCRDLYAQTATRLLEEGVARGPVADALRGALESAAASTATAGSWALRKAFDKIISDFLAGAVVDTLPAKSEEVDERWMLVRDEYVSSTLQNANLKADELGSDDDEGCYDIYRDAAALLLGNKQAGGNVAATLRAALKAAERTRDFDDKAWAMRRTFDSVLEELKQRAKTLNRLLLVGKSVSAQPLIRAVVTGSVSTVAARLAAGDDIDCTDHLQRTPLIVASLLGHTEIVGLLLSKEAERDSEDKNGATALDAAYRSGNDDVVYLLSTLSEAIKRGEYPLIARIMAWPKVDVNEADVVGKTPLMYAAERGLKDIVAQLIEAGADFELEDARGWSALDFAKNNGRTQVVQLLELTLNKGLPHNYSCDVCGVCPIPAGLMYQCLQCRSPAADGSTDSYDVCGHCWDNSKTDCKDLHRMVCFSSAPGVAARIVAAKEEGSDDESSSDDECLLSPFIESSEEEDSDGDADDDDAEDEDADASTESDSETYTPPFELINAALFDACVASKSLTVVSFELEHVAQDEDEVKELSALAKKYAKQRFRSLLCSDSAAAKLAQRLSVTRVPAFVIFQSGAPLFTLVGNAADAAALAAALERAVSKDTVSEYAKQEKLREAAAKAATKLLDGGKATEAVAQFTAALEAGTCGNRRRAELTLGRARASLKAAVTSAPADDDAAASASAKKDFDSAERDASTVMALQPNDAIEATAQLLRAQVRQALGKLAAATSDCQDVVASKVADATTLKAARSLLASLVQPARAVSRWQSAGKLVTSAVAVAAPAQEAKQLKPKAEALQAAAAAASTAKPAEADADDAEELQAAVQFWEDWEASKGKPDSKSWTDQQVKLCVRARILSDGTFFARYKHVFSECADIADVLELIEDDTPLQRGVHEAARPDVTDAKKRADEDKRIVKKLLKKLKELKEDLRQFRPPVRSAAEPDLAVQNKYLEQLIKQNAETAQAFQAAQAVAAAAALADAVAAMKEELAKQAAATAAKLDAHHDETHAKLDANHTETMDALAAVRDDFAAGIKGLKSFVFSLSERTVPCVVLVSPGGSGKEAKKTQPKERAASFGALLRHLSLPPQDDAFRLHVLCEYGPRHLIEEHSGYALHGDGPRLSRVLTLVRGSVVLLQAANFISNMALMGTAVIPPQWLDSIVDSCKKEKVSAEKQRTLLASMGSADAATLEKQLSLGTPADSTSVAALGEFLADAEQHLGVVSWRRHLFRCHVKGEKEDEVLFCCAECIAKAKGALVQAAAVAEEAAPEEAVPPQKAAASPAAAAEEETEDDGLQSHKPLSAAASPAAAGGCCALQ